MFGIDVANREVRSLVSYQQQEQTPDAQAR